MSNNLDIETESRVEEHSGVYIHQLKVPFKYGGETYQELTFDFECLTGKDMIAIESEMQKKNEYAIAPEVSRLFQCLMAAKASGIGEDVLRALPFGDFTKITNAARNFLIATGY